MASVAAVGEPVEGKGEGTAVGEPVEGKGTAASSGATGNSAIVASVAAVQQPVGGKALPKDLPKGTRKITDLEKPSGAVHLGRGNIYITLARAARSLRKNFVLHSLMDGTINTTNGTRDGCVSYDLHRGSRVSIDGEIGRLDHFLSDAIKAVWGKDLQGSKVMPKLLANGKALDLYWSAKTEEDTEACKALVNTEGVRPLFVMTEKAKELTPAGVIFTLHNGMKFDRATTVAKLPRKA